MLNMVTTKAGVYIFRIYYTARPNDFLKRSRKYNIKVTQVYPDGY